jgi:two-component system nitrogen regulation sensor histidine kinase NtrY
VSEVELLVAMVQEFSDFAKLPEIRPRRSGVMPILEDVVNIFRDSHPAVRWSLRPDPETGRLILPDVEVDSAAMHRAFLNILTNAVEALEGQPDARVEIRAAHEPDARLLRVDIVDNGPGLSADERKRVFEPYFTRKKTGTGLGLTIVRSIITEHRGYVRAFAPGPVGLGISVELPVA